MNDLNDNEDEDLSFLTKDLLGVSNILHLSIEKNSLYQQDILHGFMNFLDRKEIGYRYMGSEILSKSRFYNEGIRYTFCIDHYTQEEILDQIIPRFKDISYTQKIHRGIHSVLLGEELIVFNVIDGFFGYKKK